MKRVTIKDVARESGVSIKTVSNVLNGSGSMRPETRKRVEETMLRIGYSLNASARSLKTGSSHLLGLATFNFSQPFPALFADMLIKEARKRQYGVMIDAYDLEGVGLEQIMGEISSMGADGWVFLADRALANGGAILNQPYPVVLVGDYAAHDRADSVMMPNVEAVRYATSRLLETGMRRVGLIGAPERQGIETVFSAVEGGRPLRTRGYVEAFESAGLKVDWHLVVSGGKWNRPDGERAVKELLGRGACPQAIVCLNDALALGAMHELQRRGIRIPDDVEIVGFDNVPDARYVTPTLTTIDPNVRDCARQAINMLIERIEGYDGPARTYTTDFTLVERASTRLG